MRPPRHVGRFFLLVAVIYAGLMVPWPGLERGYAAIFRGMGNAFFARFWFWPDGTVRFLNLKDLKPGDLPAETPEIAATGTFDTLMELRSRSAPGSLGYLRTSSRYVGYGPTVVVIALIAATPLPWARRLWALLWGLLFVHLFVVFRLTLTLLAGGFAADKNYALFHLGPFWRGVLTHAESIFTDDPTVSFVVPALIWFLVALRSVLWQRAEIGNASSSPVQKPPMKNS